MSFRTLNPSARIFLITVVLSGGLAALACSQQPAPNNYPLLLSLVGCGILFSTWQLEIALLGTVITLGSAVLCLSQLLLGAPATLLCAVVGAAVSTVTRPEPGKWLPRFRRAEPEQLLFNVAVCSLATASGAITYDAILWWADPGGSPGLAGRVAGVTLFQTVYFLVNSWAVSFLQALVRQQPVGRLWSENFLWTWPSYYLSAFVAVPIYVLYVYTSVGSAAVLGLAPLYLLYFSYRLHVDRMDLHIAALEQNMRHIEELKELNSAIIASLARAIDAKDRYTNSHIQRVQTYAVGLAEARGLSGPELEAVRTAALVHDVGKLGVPERILGKPGKLTPEEFRRIQDHVTIGAEILSPVPFSYPVIPIVLTHHERWDGLGYPSNLSGEDIPIGGRILTIADVFDALTSNRPYRRAMPTEEALEMLRADAGRRFDPNLVELFAEILPDLHAQVLSQEAAAAETLHLGESDSETVDSSRAFGWTTQAGADMSATHELAHDLAATSTVDQVAEIVLERALRLLPADCGAVFLAQDPTGDLLAERVLGRCADKLQALLISSGEGVSGWVAQSMQPQINAPAALDIARRFQPHETIDLTAATAVPLVHGGRTLGVLTLYTMAYSALNIHHLRVLNVLAEHAAAAIVNARRYELTQEFSLTDPVTGLPNSRGLIRHVEMLCERTAHPGAGPHGAFAVLMFDLDGFKGVNDAYGHLSGDELLQRFGRALRGQCTPRDFCCRYAGDEFVLVLEGGGSPQAEGVAAAVRAAVQGELPDWVGVPLDVSFGYSTCPADGDSPATLLGVADQRMYNDKFHRRAGSELPTIPEPNAPPTGAAEHAPAAAAQRGGVP